jgi:hypothetical protein
MLFLIDINVKQTPSHDTDTPRSFFFNLRFDLIKISIPSGRLVIFLFHQS